MLEGAPNRTNCRVFRRVGQTLPRNVKLFQKLDIQPQELCNSADRSKPSR